VRVVSSLRSLYPVWLSSFHREPLLEYMGNQTHVEHDYDGTYMHSYALVKPGKCSTKSLPSAWRTVHRQRLLCRVSFYRTLGKVSLSTR
jgi:hypothetical protein